MKRAKIIRLSSLGLVLVLLFTLWGDFSPLPKVQTARASSPPKMLYGSAPDAPDSELQAIIEDVVGQLPGTWGVVVKKLDTGQYATFNADTQQVSASLYKLWVLCELYHQAQQGIIHLADISSVTGDDAYYDAMSGDVHLSQGDSVDLLQAANLMITLSDNTSAHLLVRTLGPDNINRFMQQNGLTHSYLDWSGVGDNLTTPLDVLRELEMLATSKMVDAKASSDMLSILLGQQINNLLPVGLPDGVPFAHKTGALDSLLHDAGIVYSRTGPYIIVAMSSELESYATAYDAVPELSRRIYKYFTSRPTSPTLYFPQTRESVGHDFLKYWHAYGGLQTFGYPISPEYMKGGLLVQQFERARFELQPEKVSIEPYSMVSLGVIGIERAAQLGLSWPPGPNPGTGKYFPQTGQVLTDAFLDYWLNNGGEKLFGYPISPAANMVSQADGKSYMTQWFERARMEIHPELPAGHRIVLGTLGSELSPPQ